MAQLAADKDKRSRIKQYRKVAHDDLIPAGFRDHGHNNLQKHQCAEYSGITHEFAKKECEADECKRNTMNYYQEMRVAKVRGKCRQITGPVGRLQNLPYAKYEIYCGPAKPREEKMQRSLIH